MSWTVFVVSALSDNRCCSAQCEAVCAPNRDQMLAKDAHKHDPNKQKQKQQNIAGGGSSAPEASSAKSWTVTSGAYRHTHISMAESVHILGSLQSQAQKKEQKHTFNYPSEAP